MKVILSVLASTIALSGCYVRVPGDADSPVAQFVGRNFETKKEIAVYDRGAFGRLGVPAGEWFAAKKEKVALTVDRGSIVEVVGTASRLLESGRHYFLACRYRTAEGIVTFDYPADKKYIGPEYLLWK